MAASYITTDSELLTNYISAELVSDNGHFVACTDTVGSPMFLRLTDKQSDGSGAVLQLIKKSSETKPWDVYDFTTLVPAAKGRQVQAFDLRQDASNRIFVSVAVVNGESSELLVLKPFTIKADDVLRGSNAKSLDCYESPSISGTIYALFMVSVSKRMC